jgi:hypothetical protein
MGPDGHSEVSYTAPERGMKLEERHTGIPVFQHWQVDGRECWYSDGRLRSRVLGYFGDLCRLPPA